MGGQSYRVPQAEAATWWRVHRDGFGEWQIVDAAAADPLRTEDAVARLRARYLAAGAPTLKYAVTVAARELERAWGHVPPYSREGLMVAWLYDVLHSTRPLASEEMELEVRRDQLALYLEAAA